MVNQRKIKDGSYESVLPSVKMTQIGGTQRVFSGVGHIRIIDGRWRISAVFEAAGVSDVMLVLPRPRTSNLTDEGYIYDIEAETWDGEVIFCEREHPRFSYSSAMRMAAEISPRHVVFGKPKSSWRAGHSLEVVLEDTVGWSERVRVEKDAVGRFIKPDWAVHSDDEYDIHTLPVEGYSHIYIRSAKGQKLPEDSPQLITLVAIYVLGEMKGVDNWHVCEKKDDENEVWHAYVSKMGSKPKPQFTPLMCSNHDAEHSSAMQLLALCSKYAVANPAEALDVFSHTRSFYESINQGATETALSASVTIEHLAAIWCPDSALELPANSNIEQLKSLVNWGAADEDTVNKLKKRFESWLGFLKQGGAASRLRVLERCGVVPVGTFEAWNDLRHRVAHGGRISYEDDTWEKTCRLIDGIHSLISWRVGYNGALGHYAKLNYPLRHYESPPFPIVT